MTANEATTTLKSQNISGSVVIQVEWKRVVRESRGAEWKGSGGALGMEGRSVGVWVQEVRQG